MIILLPKPPVQECQCALCNVRRLDDEQHTIDRMEDRLRSLREGVPA